MKNKTIYIAGPITGHDLKERFEAFEIVENKCNELGFNVVNPMKLKHDHDKSWGSYMRECIEVLIKCDAIYLMKDWEISNGARLEFTIASKLKMQIIDPTNEKHN